MCLYMDYLAARIPGFDLMREREHLHVRSPFKSPYFNIGLGNADPTEIARVVDFYRETGQPFSWWVNPSQSMDEKLKRAGLKLTGRNVGLACLPSALKSAPHRELTITCVEDRAGLREFHRIQVEAGVHPDVFDSYYGKLPAEAYLDAPFRFYLGRHHGEVVTGGIAVDHAGVTGIYRVATVPKARHQGHAKALTAHMVGEAFARGSEAIVLEASERGASLYESLGFSKVCDWWEYSYPLSK